MGLREARLFPVFRAGSHTGSPTFPDPTITAAPTWHVPGLCPTAFSSLVFLGYFLSQCIRGMGVPKA